MKKADYIDALVKAEMGTEGELNKLTVPVLKAMHDGVTSAQTIATLEKEISSLKGQKEDLESSNEKLSSENKGLKKANETLTGEKATLTGAVKERDEIIQEQSQQIRLKEMGQKPGSDRTFSHKGKHARFLSPKLQIDGVVITPELCREKPELAKLAFESKSPLIELITEKTKE